MRQFAGGLRSYQVVDPCLAGNQRLTSEMGAAYIGSHSACHPEQARRIMNNFKFVVRVSRAGIHAAQIREAD